MHELGVRLALDDFGTGYSNLSVVESLPIDVVKFDRSLVDRIGEPRPFEFLSGMIELFYRLGLTLVVEGVETEEQLAQLARIERPTLVQGFVFGRPLPSEQLAELLTRTSVPVDRASIERAAREALSA